MVHRQDVPHLGAPGGLRVQEAQDPDRRHIIGHNQMPGCPGAGGGVSCHKDPGRHWNWQKYMSLIRHYR